jgi:glycosyltransferase involved in cell wall biosynthesis
VTAENRVSAETSASETVASDTDGLAANQVPSGDRMLLVHDYLLVMRGAERTFEAIANCYPDATIATLLYDRVGTEGRFAHRHVRTSFLQPFAADQRRFRQCLPLLPLAAGRLRVRDARLVVSSSSAFAHGVHQAGDAVHISYCHSPFRYVWHERARTERRAPLAVRPALRAVLGAVRQWDVRAATRVDAFFANSELTRQRIGDFYGRDAIVVHPPVDLDRFSRRPDPRDYFLMVGEVTRHKNSEVALVAAEKAEIKLTVVGAGPDLPRLRERFRRAEFLGRVGDDRLSELYANCRALVVPAVEEFGITMVEAHAARRPVLAAASGGALEIVTDGVTGVLVPPRDVDALAEALRATDWERFDPVALGSNAARFSPTEFRKRFSGAVAHAFARARGHKATAPAPPGLLPARPNYAHATAIAVASSTLGGSLARSRHRP